jgi:hypothetical protein
MSGESYSLTSADVGKLLLAPYIMEVRINTSAGIPIGAQVDFLQTGGEDIIFIPGAGVTLNSKGNNRRITSRYSPASLKCVGTNSYVLIGDLAA